MITLGSQVKMHLLEITFGKKWNAIVFNVRKRILTDWAIAYWIAISCVVKTSTSLALVRVVNVVAKSIATDEHSFTTAKTRSASSLRSTVFIQIINFTLPHSFIIIYSFIFTCNVKGSTVTQCCGSLQFPLLKSG